MRAGDASLLLQLARAGRDFGGEILGEEHRVEERSHDLGDERSPARGPADGAMLVGHQLQRAEPVPGVQDRDADRCRCPGGVCSRNSTGGPPLGEEMPMTWVPLGARRQRVARARPKWSRTSPTAAASTSSGS